MSRKKTEMLINDLSESERDKLDALLKKKAEADRNHTAFVAEVKKRREEVLRILEVNQDTKAQEKAAKVPEKVTLSAEQELKMKVGEAAIAWGKSTGYTPEFLLKQFPEWDQQNKNKNQQKVPAHQTKVPTQASAVKPVVSGSTPQSGSNTSLKRGPIQFD